MNGRKQMNDTLIYVYETKKPLKWEHMLDVPVLHVFYIHNTVLHMCMSSSSLS